jgi:hypothetical protein
MANRRVDVLALIATTVWTVCSAGCGSDSHAGVEGAPADGAAGEAGGPGEGGAARDAGNRDATVGDGGSSADATGAEGESLMRAPVGGGVQPRRYAWLPYNITAVGLSSTSVIVMQDLQSNMMWPCAGTPNSFVSNVPIAQIPK